MPPVGAIAEAFDVQAGWCGQLGSPLYESLLGLCAREIRSGGPIVDIVEGFGDDPTSAALALRFMGGVHRLVLMGIAPGLARHFPSVGGHPDEALLSTDFMEVIASHPGYLTDSLAIAPQTNETARSGALFPGIHAAVGGPGFSVRLLEIGASAGLNLVSDRFRYRTAAWSWGATASPVVISPEWNGPEPTLVPDLTVAERHGCDVMPLDPAVDEARLRLLSFVWPDQQHRITRMRGAMDIAQRVGVRVDEADAAMWLAQRLDEPVAESTITIVQQSVIWQYLDPSTKHDIEASLDAAGANATVRRPVAHVALEPQPEGYDHRGFALSVTRWPGEEKRILGYAHAHGTWVDWVG